MLKSKRISEISNTITESTREQYSNEQLSEKVIAILLDVWGFQTKIEKEYILHEYKGRTRKTHSDY